jgi:hypothetical protein
MLKEPSSGGGLLLLRRDAPLTRRTVAYFCSGAHTMYLSEIEEAWKAPSKPRIVIAIR